MNARTRVWLLALAAAAVAVAVTLGVVALTRDDPAATESPPPYVLELGLRNDAQARALRQAAELYNDGRIDDARAIFHRYRTPEARVGAALASWPDTLPRLRALPQGSAIVRLHQGIVLATVGDVAAARVELEAAKRVEPDTPYAVRADDLLHPRFAPGLPLFTASTPYPADLAALPPGRQLAVLAHRRGLHDRLRYGAALQRLGMPVSAQRVFDAAARAAPADPEVLTAAAVGRFDKDDPSAAFSRLGPLARRFPRAQSPRFHLGLLLLWIGDVDGAKRQLRQARDLGPGTRLGAEAKRFLDRL